MSQPTADQSSSSDAVMDMNRDMISWITLGILTAILVYTYWNSLVTVSGTWDSPQYSHGYLVPLFAAALLWMRRQSFEDVPSWHRWLGLGVIAVSIGLRIVATRNVLFTVDFASFVPALLGVFILVGGLKALRWAGPPIVFLVFMFPLPRVLVDNLLRPLQLIATKCSLFALQTLGLEVYGEGNVILLESQAMNVVDQCSGLRMVTIFLALAAALAMVATSRPLWERWLILASAVPIALAVNVIRITVTGLLYNMDVNSEIAQKVFHDWAGYIMMPLALGFLFLELQIISRLVVEVPVHETGRVGFSSKLPTESNPK